MTSGKKFVIVEREYEDPDGRYYPEKVISRPMSLHAAKDLISLIGPLGREIREHEEDEKRRVKKERDDVGT